MLRNHHADAIKNQKSNVRIMNPVSSAIRDPDCCRISYCKNELQKAVRRLTLVIVLLSAIQLPILFSPLKNGLVRKGAQLCQRES